MGRKIKKLYYSIGEVSEIVDLKQYVLRYWESEFSSLSPSKNRAGNRVYRERDILLIRYIKHLLYDKKFTIEGAKQKLKELKAEDLKNFEENATPQVAEPDVPEKPILSPEVKDLIKAIRTGLRDILQMLDE